jgi:Uma2 family endonuclease
MEAIRSDKLLTADEYSRLPDDGWRYELQAGILLSEPQPLLRHAQVQAELIYVLKAFVERLRLGAVFGPGGYLLSSDPDTVRGPDVSFVRADRFDPEEAAHGFFRGAPDLAIEILSPSNRPGEMHAKVADYLAAGAMLVWVIDPEHRIVTIYRTLLSPRRIGSDGTLDGEDVLPGFSVPASILLA